MSQPPEPPGLPASLARQIQVSAYVFSGSTAVLFWDILNNLRSDYYMLFKQKLHMTSAAYVVSRIASSVYVLGFTLFASYPLRACNTAHVVFDSFFPIAVSAAAYLFFSRVRAIYGGARLVSVVFGVLMLGVFGISMTIPIAGAGNAIAVGEECLVVRIQAYSGTAGIMIMVYDTLVFLAISYRLVANFDMQQEKTINCNWVARARILFSGSNLPAFSKSLFTDGQMYYLIAVIANVVTTLMVYVPDISAVYHGILVIPNVALTSIMACRVYRNTRLIRNGREFSLPTLNSLSASRDIPIPLSVVRLPPEHTGITGSSTDVEGERSHSSPDKSDTLNSPAKTNIRHFLSEESPESYVP
ncbi:hypothetical protein DFH07DRAFT_973911 [Mycena maculata]|uniref:Uncharacterized protein n=1 Tax=Mycena maculata TaxID=230809 RepID=A0AAD7HB21_9AGAR|nr:hypothetical protein DFH07DRAFT_973911 [Mycena maculata]